MYYIFVLRNSKKKQHKKPFNQVLNNHDNWHFYLYNSLNGVMIDPMKDFL